MSPASRASGRLPTCAPPTGSSPGRAVRRTHCGSGATRRSRSCSSTGCAATARWCFASAAALTLGSHTIPVYEIYKAGEPASWVPGLDVVRSVTGLPAVIIPHFDNAEGGHHDTRFCYLGERRLSMMERELAERCVHHRRRRAHRGGHRPRCAYGFGGRQRHHDDSAARATASCTQPATSWPSTICCTRSSGGRAPKLGCGADTGSHMSRRRCAWTPRTRRAHSSDALAAPRYRRLRQRDPRARAGNGRLGRRHRRVRRAGSGARRSARHDRQARRSGPDGTGPTTGWST